MRGRAHAGTSASQGASSGGSAMQTGGGKQRWRDGEEGGPGTGQDIMGDRGETGKSPHNPTTTTPPVLDLQTEEESFFNGGFVSLWWFCGGNAPDITASTFTTNFNQT